MGTLRRVSLRPDQHVFPSDVELLRGVLAADSDALEQLYRRHRRRTLALIRRIVADEFAAEEILQDVFLKLWTRPGAYDEAQGALNSWLFGIARHLALERRRCAMRSAARVSAEDRGPEPDWEETLAEAEQARAVKIALDDLPAAQRETIQKAFLEGFTQAEVASLLGQPVGTIKSRIRLGLQKLRESCRERAHAAAR